ncbi:protein serine/threonine kinase [Aureococcus anophagefferens]|uniref:Protein serine/threonine kinase n=1 Tax=Aureococcus anophagefferens TaxID=44056 RepID=A0ABR1FQD1_AURAN
MEPPKEEKVENEAKAEGDIAPTRRNPTARARAGATPSRASRSRGTRREFEDHAPNEKARVINEVRLLDRLEHENIIDFHGSWVNRERGEVCFITEILSSGSLKKFINKVQVVRWKIIKRWVRQILKALAYLHSQTPPIIHRDIKCENIFINGSTGDLRIGDLGLSTAKKVNEGKGQSVLGTPEFMAPELYDEEYDEKVDVFAFGMCVLEMITKQLPYSECTNATQIYRKVCGNVPPDALRLIPDDKALDFVKGCIQKDPAERLGAAGSSSTTSSCRTRTSGDGAREPVAVARAVRGAAAPRRRATAPRTGPTRPRRPWTRRPRRRSPRSSTSSGRRRRFADLAEPRPAGGGSGGASAQATPPPPPPAARFRMLPSTVPLGPVVDGVVTVDIRYAYDGIEHSVDFEYDISEPSDVAVEFAGECGYGAGEVQPFAEFLQTVRAPAARVHHERQLKKFDKDLRDFAHKEKIEHENHAKRLVTLGDQHRTEAGRAAAARGASRARGLAEEETARQRAREAEADAEVETERHRARAARFARFAAAARAWTGPSRPRRRRRAAPGAGRQPPGDLAPVT